MNQTSKQQSIAVQMFQFGPNHSHSWSHVARVAKKQWRFHILLHHQHLFPNSTSSSIYFVFIVPDHNQIHSLICLPLPLHPPLPSPSFSPSLQCWMSAILPPALLFSDEANGGPSIKGHQATLPLAVHQSLYSDWLAGRGLVALPFPLTFPADPEVLTSPTVQLQLCLHIHGQAHVWIKYAHELWKELIKHIWHKNNVSWHFRL